ncbi:Eco57I restriction-modification methylase domain-containing protein [Priestia aryabhattai]|uniref:Eco57I restriction-modification methylase domain-containing protein n=1 Tax=Priestia aryabhattai TaxID=412384 RepID=UPI003D7F46F2
MEGNLFNPSFLTQKISKEYHIDDWKSFESKKNIIKKWVLRIEDETINDLNEVQLQGEFIRDIFSGVLLANDYLSGKDEWNVIREEKTRVDGAKADAVLGFFNKDTKDYRAAIELKGPKVHLDLKQKRLGDNRTPVEQGFSYLPKYGKKCNWLILSNYKEIRLYHHTDSSEYISFRLIDLLEEHELINFIYVFSFNFLISRISISNVERLLNENIEIEQGIENSFYKLYTATRDNLFNTILKNNEDISGRVALEKTQKLIDRFIFVCFAEDRSLLPKNIFHQSVEHGKNSLSLNGVWESVRGLFNSIDAGNTRHGINKFNGGLFKPDPDLDNLNLPNEIFEELNKIASYDFNSELNVNVLGHIFEQSISDLEEMKAKIDGINFDEKKGKRKKDGIFYTPNYITKYIIENTVGQYLLTKRKELGEEKLPKLKESDFKVTTLKNGKLKYSNNILKHIKFWEEYRELVSHIKILDPACGSGAFLNEVFDYLYKLGKEINDTLESYTGMPSLFDLDRTILQHNLYGVDVNKESIEITKLSLWLKTANKSRELTTLDNNIKCGNSLISDSHVAPENAFDWYKEFPEVMENGGFDIIIGNPPYVRNTTLRNIEKDYYSQEYLSATGQYDLYVLFNELAIKLIKREGLIGFIQPNKFLSAEYGVMLLNIIEKSCDIKIIKNVSQDKVFQGASVYPYIFILEKKNEIPISIDVENKNIFDMCEPSKLINFEEEIRSRDIIYKILRQSNKLSEFSGKAKRGVPNSKLILSDGDTLAVKSTAIKTPYYMNEDFVKIRYKSEKYFEEKEHEFNQTLILMPRTVKKIRAVLNKPNVHILDRIYYFPINQNSNLSALQIMAFLNSNITTFYYNYKYGNTKIGGGYFDLKGTQINELPLPKSVDETAADNLKLIIDELIAKYEDLYNSSEKFSNRILANFSNDKLANGVSEFLNVSFTDFLKALKKHGIKLKLREQDEWEDYFLDKQKSYLEIIEVIKKLESKLNGIVYDIYNLSNEERKTVEDVITKIKN